MKILFPKKKSSNTVCHNNSKKNDKNLDKSNKEDMDNYENLSSAYKNINQLLTNCIESIRNDDNNEETINSPVFKSVSGLIKKISPRKPNKIIKYPKPFIFNKSNSLSNSNAFLMKSSEDNCIKSLNTENESKKAIFHKKTSPLKILDKKKSTVSQKSSNKILSNVEEKLKSPKHNPKSAKHVMFAQSKDDKKGERKSSIYNMKELKKNFSIHKKKTNASHKTNKTINKNNKNNKKVEFSEKAKYFSNIEVFSPKSLRNKKNSKKSKIKRRKNKLNTLGFVPNVNIHLCSPEKAKSENHHLTKKSASFEKKNSYELKRPNTMVIQFKNYSNILDGYIKKTPKNSRLLKSSKKSLKILTLEQIGENVKQSITNNQVILFSKVESNLLTDDINYSSEIKNKKTDECSNNNLDKYQQKYRKLFIIHKVYDSLDDEEIGDEEVDNFYLSPNSPFIYFIDTLVFVSSFFELFYLPYYLGYKKNFCRDILSFESILFHSIDLVYIIDLIIGFFLAYYDFEEFLIRNNCDIIIHYLKGWFIIDLIEAIPLFTIFSFNEKKCTEYEKYYLYNMDKTNFHYSFLIIKIFKIFKAFNHNSSMSKIINTLNNYDFFSNWNDVVFTLLVAISLIHFCSCFFIYLGRNFYSGWIKMNGIQDRTFGFTYVSAIYYLMTTLTTVGYGDITVFTTYERIYQIILLIVGTCAYSWILTFISNYIKKMNEKYIDFENKVKILTDIRITYPLLKNDLYEKIIRYLKYNKDENKYNVNYILDSLPLSLKNNVIIDMYKPIIKNFQFFKSFQNSDFFVKIVTSLKPVLSMKDDILVQEGDVIEDIIFIKKGVLSLEICIDLDNPQESVESYLNPNNDYTHNFDQLKTIKTGKCNSLNSSNNNYTKNKFNTFIKKKLSSSNKKEMNIINLRKNEHYGDILMILNERSPLTVRVKSKKAELFFLQKTEATEISNKYPNIWKRIVHKSLFNMKQIKYLIKKKIIIFCDLNGIFISPEKRKIIDDSNELIFNTDSISKKNSSTKNKVIESNDNLNLSKKSAKDGKKNIDTIIYEEDDDFESNRNSYSYIRTSLNTLPKNLNSIYSGKKEKTNERIGHFSSNNIRSGLKSFLNKSITSNNSFKKDKQNEKNNTLLVLNSGSNSGSNSASNSVSNSNSNSNTTSKNKKIRCKFLSKDEIYNFHGNKKEKEKEIIIDNKDEKNYNLLNNKINKMLTAMDRRMKQNIGHINNLNINFYTYKTVNYPKNNNNNKERNSDFSESNKKYSEEDNEINEEIYSDENFNLNLAKENVCFNNSDKNNNITYPYLNNYFEVKNNTNLNLSKLLERNKNETSSLRENSQISKNSDLLKSTRFSNLYTTTSISFTINSIYENMNKLTGYRLKDKYLQNKIRNYILDECFFQSNSINYNNFHMNSPEDKKQRSINHFETVKRNSNSSSMIAKNSSFLGINKFTDEKPKKIKIRNSLKLRKKRKLSDNSFQFDQSKSIEGEKKYLRRNRRSLNFRQHNNLSFLNYSNISNKNIHLQQDDTLLYKRRTSKISMKLNDDEEMSFYTKMKTIRNNKNLNDKNNNSLISKPKKTNLMDQISQNIQKNKQNLNNPEEYFSGFFSNILQRKKTISRKPPKMAKKSTNTNIKRMSTSSEAINRNKISHEFKI